MLTSDPKLLCRFLTSCGGNWHRTVYVSCKRCICDTPCGNSDFLFVSDQSGHPVCLSLADATILFPERPVPDECLFALTIRQFCDFYAARLLQLPHGQCPARWLTQKLTDTLYDW